MNFLISGAIGFIGSNFVNFYQDKYPESKIIVLDKKDYCSSEENITNKSIKVIIGNILDQQLVSNILYDNDIDIVIHFAAESHVDNSFNNSLEFTKTNVLGTHTMLESARLYNNVTGKITKFIHVSTDECYGQSTIDDEVKTETSLLKPSNPYAATKAAAEHIVFSYYESFKFPIIITRANNVFGVNQYPEKLIPKFICQLLDGKVMTIHGQGLTRRNFIHVDDVCTAYETIIKYGKINEVYNISACKDNEFSVKEIADMLIDITGSNKSKSISYVEDRNINDFRYYTSSEKLEKLGWKPVKTNFKEEVTKLVDWYEINRKRYSLYKEKSLINPVFFWVNIFILFCFIVINMFKLYLREY
jgi:dTDP-glucose 4,6-dehydratase